MIKNKQTMLLWGIFAAYSALILLLVLNHEYWFDEAQAWNIARDNDIAGIFGMIKYEGHPPLWHLVLKPWTMLPSAALGLVSWGISTLTAAVILFAIPIKGYLKVALLMSSGMLYVNTVISRVYVLIMLLLSLIAVIYPHRKKHPVTFGILTALLANTHICMCGLVGIIGIFMLIDFFKDAKNNKAAQNILNVAGLMIAGCGVALLVLPMLSAFETNCYTSELTYTPTKIINALFYAFPEIVTSGCAPNIPMPLNMLFTVAVQAMLILVCIIVRRNRRVLAMLLTFTVFYMVIVNVIWYTTPNRGSLFLYTLVMIYAMCRDEQIIPRSDVKSQKKYGKLIDLFLKLDGIPQKSSSVLLAAALFISAPSGVVYAVRDLFGEFTPYKAAARFIEENISSDALLVSSGDDYAVLAAYLPDRKIYALRYNRFYTYCSHKIITTDFDEEIFLDTAKNYSEIYFITPTGLKPLQGETVYEDDVFIPFVSSDNSIALTLLNTDEVVRYAR